MGDPPLGWSLSRRGPALIWFKGYLTDLAGEDFSKAAVQAMEQGGDALVRWLKSLRGHFAFIVQSEGITVAAVDQVRSSAILYGESRGRWIVGPDAHRLVTRLGLSGEDLSSEALLSMAMAGYTVGAATAYRNLFQLRPGEYGIFDSDGSPSISRYAAYSPWLIQDHDDRAFLSQLEHVSLEILQNLVESVGDRTIVIPLSAGLDSRFIASGLSKVGYRNVKCFAYGRRGNFEAMASRRIAEKLGFDWTFVPLDRKAQRELFNGEEFKNYRDFSSSLSATPYAQDFLAIKTLLGTGWLAADSVLVNGNTGDFLSGGHIPNGVGASSDLSAERREELLLESLLSKHFRLWMDLAVPLNDRIIIDLIRNEWANAEIGVSEIASDHALFEFIEFQDRQAKYVINGQRTYEFLGLEWRLPLWDSEFLRFWESVPRHLKLGQRLYREFLNEQDWGNVWSGWDFPRKVVPRGMRPPLAAARLLSLLMGQRDWMPVERRFFSYWLDVLNYYAVVPYGRVAFDGRGARNAISWHTEEFFRSHELPWPTA